MDGRGLVASLALGAQGIQLGSRFLNVAESGADQAYQKALKESTENSTTITNTFSGRPARAIKNRFVEFHLQQNLKALEYPIQNQVTSSLRNAAKQQGKSEYMSLWAGQGIRLMKDGQTAQDVVCEIMDQANEILKV
jgi:nitronate monooxygenase